jgi:hypothetical protein
MALRFDIVRFDLAVFVEHDARDRSRSTLARPDAGKKKQISDPAGVRIQADGFGCFRGIDQAMRHL